MCTLLRCFVSWKVKFEVIDDFNVYMKIKKVSICDH